MSSKTFRNLSFLHILLFITVFSIVVLDIRFHLQADKFDDNSENRLRKSSNDFNFIGNIERQNSENRVDEYEIFEIEDEFTDETSEVLIPSKYQPHGSKESNKSEQKFRKMALHDLPPESKAGWVRTDKEEPVSRFPKSLLVGFSKCGTSSLLAFLNVHPDIVSIDWETDYLCDRVYYKYSLHWYRMRMPPSTSNQITIEKSPCYISEKKALERIRAYNSSIKILVILRDPLTRITSQHGQYLASFKASGKPKLSLEERYMNVNTGKLHDDAVRKWGIFTSRVENLYGIFPRKQIHIIDGDKFVKDPLPVLSGIERFLGVQSYFSDEDVHFDSSKGFFCPRDRASKQTECMGYQKGRPHVEMSDRLRRSLQDYIRPYSKKLFDVIGRKLNWDLGG